MQKRKNMYRVTSLINVVERDNKILLLWILPFYKFYFLGVKNGLKKFEFQFS